jgi:hypothetical protein
MPVFTDGQMLYILEIIKKIGMRKGDAARAGVRMFRSKYPKTAVTDMQIRHKITDTRRRKQNMKCGKSTRNIGTKYTSMREFTPEQMDTLTQDLSDEKIYADFSKKFPEIPITLVSFHIWILAARYRKSEMERLAEVRSNGIQSKIPEDFGDNKTPSVESAVEYKKTIDRFSDDLTMKNLDKNLVKVTFLQTRVLIAILEILEKK